MTTARREQLREIMQMAWSWFRQVGGTFADALRTAWRSVKVRRAPKLRVINVCKSPVISATDRVIGRASLAARYDARRAAWMGSKVAMW